MMDMKREVIIALDFPSGDDAIDFLNKIGEDNLYVKVGMELYYREGNDILRRIKDMGHRIFLDLKLHDIPNTVKNGMKSLTDQDVDMLNVHAAGGLRMMKAAVEGVEDASRKEASKDLFL